MESFFLSETVKYLYLLFDPDNFIHSEGEDFLVVNNPRGKCVVNAGGYIFNTEAHPMDPAALLCCSGPTEQELHEEVAIIDEFRLSQPFTGNQNDAKKALKLFETTAEELPEDIVPKEEPVKEIIGKETKSSTITVSSGSCAPESSFLEHYTHTSNAEVCETRNDEDLALGENSAEEEVPPPKGPAEDEAETQSLLERILKKLFEDHEELNKQAQAQQLKISELEMVSGPDPQVPGLVFQESKKIEKMVQNFESASGTVEKVGVGLAPGNRRRKRRERSSNRIRRTRGGSQEEPDLNLIFGPKNERSLSFYFSLKWLHEFPELIRQLIPSERFDIQSFYAKLSENQDFSDESFSRQFNFSKSWLSNYRILKCPEIELPDRFMFFKSSVDGY